MENRRAWWRRWLGRDGDANPYSTASFADDIRRRLGRKVVPGLPRPGTFRRQQSELRDNLTQPNPDEHRAFSVDRRRGEGKSPYSRRSSSAWTSTAPRTSAPDVLMGRTDGGEVEEIREARRDEASEIRQLRRDELEKSLGPSEFPTVDTDAISNQDDAVSRTTGESVDDAVRLELERRWILNLSMHFRDRSNREKFFVTYAERPNRWRRVTLSLDYREAKPDSLEYDLWRTRFQRDKMAKIYTSIRESLQDIQFFETVTNLKLQTDHDRLHVHVTEDVHEIISYPPISAINHLDCRRIREEDLRFDSHISGFVYKVFVGVEVFIKKEIPGPDTVEEFLYEINALKRLSGSSCVIRFGGVIVDNEEKLVKGLLISYAEKGDLKDILYGQQGELPWYRRQRWAKQIVQGLSEIHEAGFVQGDFTLSNIVIDADDNAKIIDINRRGCPVGWEPPEVADLIESNQRITMYIGVKSDIFQLGMVLWAIAMEQDEPEAHQRPLNITYAPPEIPPYFRDIVSMCLSYNPRQRLAASVILDMFPFIQDAHARTNSESMASLPRSMAECANSVCAMNRNDIERFCGIGRNDRSSNAATHTYVDEPYFSPRRGRSPSPRPVNGHSIFSSSNGNSIVLEKGNGSSSQTRSKFNDNYTKHIRLVSPPSPPPTAEQWIDPLPAYIENEKMPLPQFLDFDLESSPHPLPPAITSLETDEHQNSPRETPAAGEPIPFPNSYLTSSNGRLRRSRRRRHTPQHFPRCSRNH